ncbi:126aa long hypothetical protein [Pyrococcus horikoshii OT3]|uniref:Uncharacterized protein n=1 Tax=Pyrococcus horikoshii (strain ATCC 700860 / DSM 12428 / JCM 9974 / NBRC 100139 / OT-3) TaxID=70601 RepID=O58233_PYRHO|nr:126aa long hypothetical protein [Pyrococcus horikoshii OT3]
MGPEAMASRLSPTTSEIISTIPVPLIIFASLPPLTFDICFLTVFISCIFAPLFRRRSVVSLRSSREIPSSGSSNSAEPPPEIRMKTMSFSLALFNIDRASLAPNMDFSSGIGCPASITFILFNSFP